MMKKIFIIFVGLILFSLFKPFQIFAICTSPSFCYTLESTCADGGFLVGSGSCSGGVCCKYPPSSTPRPTATNTPRPPTTNLCITGTCYLNSICSDWGLCQGSGTCGTDNNCCITCPQATATPTAIPTINYTCDDNGGECKSEGYSCLCGAGTGTCQGMDVCCNICSTSTPTPTIPVGSSPTPTMGVCDTSTFGGCSPLANDGCESTCDDCPVLPSGVSQIRTKSGTCYSSAACRNARPVPLGPCYVYDNIPDLYFCGMCEGGVTYPVPTPYCQPFVCYNVPPPNSLCPFFDPASTCSSEGGVGNCDNCSGMDCGLCPGSELPVGPTPTPGCTETCFADPRWPTTCSDQTFGICGNTLWCYGGLNCAPTTLSSFEIRRWDATWSYTNSNVGGRDITDAQNRLHICDSFLSDESPNPRSVVYVAWLNNANGWSDIDEDSVYLRWLGDNVEHKMTRLGAGMEFGFYVAVSYPDWVNIASAQGFQITMKSINGDILTDWTNVTPDLKLKVWDCQVPVSGSIYDSSSGQTCDTGFLNLASSGMGFSSLIFDGINDVIASVTPPASYGINNLIWSGSYLPLINSSDPMNINGDLNATARMTRLIDLGTGDTHCTVANQIGVSMVSPYSASPRAQIDFSFIADQESWYQVEGAGVKSGGELTYGVPTTADPTIKFLTLGNVISDNGLVSGTSLNNTNGNNNNEFGSPKNWWITRNTNDLNNTYSYNYFYNNFYVKAGIGETKNDLWGGWEENKIYFVNGNLDIDSDFVLSDLNGGSMMVIVNGNITIDEGVSRLDGIYIANGEILVGGSSGSQMVINGMIYARGRIRLTRSFVDETVNNTTPAVKINYFPGLIFNLPPETMRVLSGWREE